MKKIDWHKTAKTIGIILIVAAVALYLDYRSSQRTEKIEDNVANLAYVSEELKSIRYDCQDAISGGDNDDMYFILLDIEERCKELQKLVDKACDYFTPTEPDDDESRRSWFY